MTTSILSAASMYTSKVVRIPYLKSCFAVLHDPAKFEYSIFGSTTQVREVIGGNAGNYTGVFGQKGKKGSVTWSSFQPMFDRDLSIHIPVKDEMDAVLQGMVLSGVELTERTWANFSGEVDATTCASIFANIPVPNVLSNVTFALDKDNIFQTFNTLDAMLLNQGYDGPAFLFLSSTKFANAQAAIIEKFGLANPSVLKVNPSLDGALEVEVSVMKYNRFYIVRVPDARMSSHVVSLDGESAGQEDGGWAPDTLNPLYKQIDALLVPPEAAALSIRHIVANISVPGRFIDFTPAGLQTSLEDIAKIAQGAIEVRNIGINQVADEFFYNNRVLYGAVTFDTWKHTMFAITTP